MAQKYRIGIDFGGTKIAAILLDEHGNVILEKRYTTIRDNYDKSISMIRNIVADIEANLPEKTEVGIGIPGSISPGTGLVQNGNSTWLNGKPLLQDLVEVLNRDVRIENDANCFVLSEAINGAATDAKMVFGVIIGTGCGGGMVFDKKLISGPHSVAGEWGHIPLPWISSDELGTGKCWCGRLDCLETWISGPGMSADHLRIAGEEIPAVQIAQNATDGDAAAIETLDRYISRQNPGNNAPPNMVFPAK